MSSELNKYLKASDKTYGITRESPIHGNKSMQSALPNILLALASCSFIHMLSLLSTRLYE